MDERTAEVIGRLNRILEELNENPRAKENHHAYIIYDDGEWVSTKAGELFGQRSFHSRNAACLPQNLTEVKWPDKSGDHGCVCLCSHSEEVVKEVWDLVKQASAALGRPAFSEGLAMAIQMAKQVINSDRGRFKEILATLKRLPVEDNTYGLGTADYIRMLQEQIDIMTRVYDGIKDEESLKEASKYGNDWNFDKVQVLIRVADFGLQGKREAIQLAKQVEKLKAQIEEFKATGARLPRKKKSQPTSK